MTEDEVNQYLQYYFMVKRPAENAEASKAWLEKTEKKSGVKKTESGLLYKVTDAGDASVMPKDPRDVVKVHYTGRTREGKVFDTSKFANRSKEQQEMMRKQSPSRPDEKGVRQGGYEPVKFPLNRVIPGLDGRVCSWWARAARSRSGFPRDLAYGARGAGRDIGPNEALEFEVEADRRNSLTRSPLRPIRPRRLLHRHLQNKRDAFPEDTWKRAPSGARFF